MAEGGVDALFDSNRRKPNPKNRVDEATEIAVLAYAIEQPAHGQVRVSNELRRRGIFVSASGVRSIWLRHALSSFKLRLVALEKQVAEKGIVLSEVQVAALERKQDDDVAHGEIETAHPGYLGSQDTFYVGTIKGVGRIYQQTFVDTYSKVAMAKLYTTKTPITAADLLNDRVLPFFEEHGMGVIRMLTDRGTEYCGKPESERHRAHQNQGATSADQWHLRAVPQNHPAGVLSGRVPPQAVSVAGGTTGRSRYLAGVLQRRANPSG